MKNSFVLSGFANNLVEIGANIGFNIAYSVKKDGEYKNVWVSARTTKGLKVEDKGRYTFEGFISGDSWVSEDKDKSKPVLVITKATKLEKGETSKNEYVFTGKPVQIKELDGGNTVGSVLYKTTNAEKVEKSVFYSFIAQKGVKVPEEELEFKGFFTGDIFEDKDGKSKNRTKLFVQSVSPATSK